MNYGNRSINDFVIYFDTLKQTDYICSKLKTRKQIIVVCVIVLFESQHVRTLAEIRLGKQCYSHRNNDQDAILTDVHIIPVPKNILIPWHIYE